MAEQAEATQEAVKNCAGCKKAISRAKRYYRNGAYYCNKNCYNKKAVEIAKEKEEAKAKAAEEEAAAKEAAARTRSSGSQRSRSASGRSSCRRSASRRSKS